MSRNDGAKSEVRLWITWERQRRSVELAEATHSRLALLEDSATGVVRYVRLAWRTVRVLRRERPAVVYGQNPSMILAALLCLLKKIFGYVLVVDRHSNFKLETIDRPGLRWRLFHALSRYSVRHADLTIVTNDFLRVLVDEWGGTGFVLQDKLPRMERGGTERLSGRQNIVCVASWSLDEPLAEVMKAAASLPPDWMVYITGRGSDAKLARHGLDRAGLPDNVRLTGFLTEEQFQTLLRSGDVLLVLTRGEHTLTCGAYEAVALSKPMVLSDTDVIRAYFSKGAVYTKLHGGDIAAALRVAIERKQYLSDDVVALRKQLQIDWSNRFQALQSTVGAYLARRSPQTSGLR